MSYYIYILKSDQNNKLYIGQTKNLTDRIARHNQNRSLATKLKGPWKIIFQEKYSTRSEAIKREKYLKSLKNKNYIEQKIINNRCGVEE